MSKKIDTNTVEETVMQQIQSGSISMKPRWYFLFGSFVLGVSVIGLTMGVLFLLSLFIFSLRTHGPMGDMRQAYALSTFPWWIPLFAVAGIFASIVLLRRYEFSYKYTLSEMVVAFVGVLFLSAFLLDYFGINTLWETRTRFGRQMRQQNSFIQQQRYLPVNGR